jgi:hypothetical protein
MLPHAHDAVGTYPTAGSASKTELAGKTQNHLRNYCSKCGVRIRSHLWIVGGNVYCGGGCQTGRGKSQFEKTYRYLASLRRDRAAS